MSRRLPAAAAALAAALVPSPDASSQESRPPATPLAFGSAVEVVRLDVSVVKDRGFVTDLAEGDLEVYEDGRRQAVTSFVRQELPMSLVLLLDASASIADRLALSQAAARGFLDTLRPVDEATLVEFNDRVTVLQSPTADREALGNAIGRISAGGTTALFNALFVALQSLPPAGSAAELRRRAIVLLSDGDDTASLVWEEQVLELARRREAAIHVIDLRPRNAGTGRSARLLRMLSQESGGDVHQPASIRDLDAAYARIRQELRSQYTVGYVSTDPAHDGRWRHIEVRVRGGRDLQVRHRSGYYDVR